MVLCHTRVGQRLLGLSPSGPKLVQGLRIQPSISIEQAAHGGWTREALPRVLTVDVHQAVADVAQLGGGGGAAIDPCAAFALRIDAALQEQIVVRFKAVVFQPRLQAGVQGKFCGNFGAAGAFTHHTGVSPSAQHQLQSVHQNRLARAGFAAEHAKALAEIQIQLPHDDKVAQADALQTHEPPSFQCSF